MRIEDKFRVIFVTGYFMNLIQSAKMELIIMNCQLVLTIPGAKNRLVF
jgi:hypothetical protein